MRLDFYRKQYIKLLQSNKVYLIRLPLAIYWIILLTLTSLPSDSIADIGTSDKIAHFGAYMILGFLLTNAIHFQKKLRFGLSNKLLAAFLIVNLYSIADEVHQLFIPGRYFDLLDLLANFIGSLSGILISHWILSPGDSNPTGTIPDSNG